MRLKWLGHACFLITSDSGVKIITDPYTYHGLGLKYDRVGESADVVTVSHGHGDHNASGEVGGNPVILNSAGKAQAAGIEISGIASYHDETQGSQRGSNIIFCLEVDGVRVCHLGDLGHALSDKQVADIGSVDVLLIPVGGKFTIDPKAARGVCDQLKSSIIVPMHVRNAGCDFVPYTADDFAKSMPNVRRVDDSEAEFKKDDLPAYAEVMILKHAR